MSQSEPSFVIKYFDLIDEFIRVRTILEDGLSELLHSGVTNKASYRRRVVEYCVPEYPRRIRSTVARLEEDYEPEIVEELLYQICIDVNPALEIHQVALPTEIPAAELAAHENVLLPQVTGESERRSMFRKVLGLEKSLRSQVVGQDEAVVKLAQVIKKAAVGLKRPGTPVGTFLMVGRTGTGKTELAKALARTLYEEPGRLVRVDCSEYALPHEYAKLIGSPPGYIGHNEGGYLTESVKKKKNCVVLFDEIEKAHHKVHNLLLQLLDEGILTDSKGQQISFAHCVVIMTSNLGVERIEALRSRMGFQNSEERIVQGQELRDVTIEALKEQFRPEFVNRIDDVVVFNPLDVKVCTRIAHRMLKEVGELLARNGISVTFSSSVKTTLAREGFSEEYGARELKRLIKRKVEDPLTELILAQDLGAGSKVNVRIRNGEPVLEVEQVGEHSLVQI